MLTRHTNTSFARLIMAVCWAVGCISPAGSSARDFRERNLSSPSQREIITESEILGQFNLLTGYDIVWRLRPEYLASESRRSTNGEMLQPVVYVDGLKAGDVSALKQILAPMIAEIRYVPPRDAMVNHGARGQGGEIRVYTYRSRIRPSLTLLRRPWSTAGRLTLLLLNERSRA